MPRGPLPWLIALEVLVLAALAFAGWHLVATRLAPPAKPTPPPTAEVTAPQPTPTPTPPTTAPTPAHTPTPHPTITPGLTTNPAFWQRNLTKINRDESAWEQVQLKAVQAVEAFTRAYLKAVVIPAVEAASQKSRAP